MRFKQFRYPLVEANSQVDFEAQKAVHDVDVLNSIVQNVPSTRQDIKMKIANNLEALANSIANFLQRTNIQMPQQAEAMQEDAGDVAEQNSAEKLKQQIHAIEASPIEDSVKQQLIKQIRDVLSENEKLAHEVEELKDRAETAEAKQKEAENFIREVSVSLVALGNKVQGYEEEDTTEMSSKERSMAKKRKINAEEFTKTLKQALFGKIVDIQEESDVTPEEIKNFLEACVQGKVINMVNVISQDKGNIANFVNPDYQKLFDIFVKQNIFSYSPGRTSGAIGPGEMALSMMGNPAEKGKKGDLLIGDEEVEIKASKATGGRLNSKAINKATSAWGTWRLGIENIVKNAPKDAQIYMTTKTGERKQVPLRRFNGDQYNITGSKSKLGSKYNWNPKGFQALNEEILAPYSNRDLTFDLMHNTIKSLVLNFDKIPNADKLIFASINEDGTCNYDNINKAYTKIAYESYHLADGITTIMFLRTDNLDYVIARDGDDLISKLGTEIKAGAGFNWNDDQQTPTPGYLPTKAA